MLTLTRKVGETIRIGDDIEIVVKEIRKNQVRIGIVAPKHVKIYREEIYDNIVAEKRAAKRAPTGKKAPAKQRAAHQSGSPKPFSTGSGDGNGDDQSDQAVGGDPKRIA